MAASDPLLTTQQVADELGMTYGGLAQMRFKGEGPVFLKLGKAVRYRRSAVDAWLAGRERTQTGQAYRPA